MNGAKTLKIKMAERTTRSSSSAEKVTKPRVAWPFNVSKKKLRKDHSDSEKEQIKKHEVQGGRFAYRLHSVQDILKRINDDQQNEEQNDASAKKKRRRSNLQRGKRRSIAETVLIKNLQKERENEGATAKSEAKKEAICGEKQEDANATHESQQQNEDERQTEIGRQKDGDELQKSADTATNVQASGRVSDGATDLTSVGEESSIDTKEKTAVDTVMDVDTTLQQTQDLTISRIDEKQQQNRPKKSISSTKLVSEEEIVAEKERQMERRKDILEKMRILKQEQEAWAELYAAYQDRLSDAKSNQSEPISGENEEVFTEEHRQFLENRIKPGEFIERLKNYRDEYMTQVNYTRQFLSTLQTFKKRASEYLKSVNIVTDDKRGEEDIKTPRRIIAKVAQAESSSA